MKTFFTVLAIVGFFVVVMLFAIIMIEGGKKEIEEKVKENTTKYEDNDEYDFGHNVDHHFLDGEGDL